MSGSEAVREIPGSIAGTEVGALSTSLDARWLMAYAAALGLDDPRYFDTLAKDGPIAHPLFSVCYEWPAVLALRAKAVRESWALLGVHSTHHVIIHRPPTVADRLLTSAHIIAARPRLADHRGSPVRGRHPIGWPDRDGVPHRAAVDAYRLLLGVPGCRDPKRRARADRAARPARAAGLVRDSLERGRVGRLADVPRLLR